MPRRYGQHLRGQRYKAFASQGYWMTRRCHIAERRTREVCVSNIFKRPRLPSRHMFIAGARNSRCVLAEMRLRWTLKVCRWLRKLRELFVLTQDT